MKFEDIHNLMQKPEVKPDTYEASMAQNQLLKIGTHAIKIHNMIDDDQEMEAWVAKKIDLASNYVKSVHGYMAGEKAGLYDDGGLTEDAGEGHMSKSQLYQTAKMAIELLDMIKTGDDLEGWVQTKLNLAADYLQAVYHYEDYQKLNPYREELDSALIQRHAGIIQKNLDEILERKCRAEDVDTKPGMMRILKKRVNEVEKEMAKKIRETKSKNEDTVNEDPRAVGRALANLKYGRDMANAIMKGEDTVSLKSKAQAYLGSIDQTIELLDKMYSMNTENLDEGIKDWAKNLAMAGVIVVGLAGINSINNAIDSSIPAIGAMETALEMAQEKGDDNLAKMIKKDLSAAKVRLSSGKDLAYVKDLQDKYAKFIATEGLNFESRLAVRLEQRIK
jgi:hypothetical protein